MSRIFFCNLYDYHEFLVESNNDVTKNVRFHFDLSLGYNYKKCIQS